MKKLLLFIFYPIVVFSQFQIGNDIDGLTAGDFSGQSVSINSAGNIIAIGALYNYSGGNGIGEGYVRIYENINNEWIQLGQTILGEFIGDQFGQSVSLNSSGNIIAIGANASSENGTASGNVRIYQYNNNFWSQLGQNIEGESSFDQSGISVSLNFDGDIIAIGAWENDGNGEGSGHARVYEFNGINWIQKGLDIDGENPGDRSGWSVSLNSSGNNVAIGALFNDGNGDGSGHVRVYEFSGTNWTQKGLDIDGENPGDRLGWSVNLDASGNYLVASSDLNSDNEQYSGQVIVYQFINSNWLQIGSDLNGEFEMDAFGTSVSLSGDGLILAVGAAGNDNNGNDSGYVRIYNLENSDWVHLTDIDGEFPGDLCGNNIELSENGEILIVGAVRNDGNGENSGHARVYDLSSVLSTASFKQDYFSYHPNPVEDVLNINLNPGLELKQVNIYNNLGQYLYSTKTTRIDVSNLNNGLYFVEVKTDQGKSTKKIVIE
ncbi:T9SS type A sorting domain-containing protein [Winogradskyella aurantia]|uniref:Secretion system C-terminal sorting domain-containing protein n=1 Tax=Winogradskyella aurantia TaxID=1915063 RepID=A0A265UZW3_9FLAO|nr:T9SS type A sorting domain-containing protein [Winogradskyella aurantia]OZV70858.1 hypothetical protein CA834_01715 [Winogradskyella aurantia]